MPHVAMIISSILMINGFLTNRIKKLLISSLVFVAASNIRKKRHIGSSYRHKPTKTKKVKAFCRKNLYFPLVSPVDSGRTDYPQYSSDTVNFALPFARRAANTRRPFAVAILARNPCLFFLFRLEGWNVLFIFLSYLLLFA